MKEYKGLLAVIVCIAILGGCGVPKAANKDPEAGGTESSTERTTDSITDNSAKSATESSAVIPDASGIADKINEDSKPVYPPDFSTEKGIREYLIGEWTYDREYLNYCVLDPADVFAKMIIDKDLNVHLSFEDKYTNESKGEFTGKIEFDRLHAKPNEAPDLISIVLGEEDYPGGDYLFKNRTIYDGKCAMSLFFAGNGNHIFELLATEDIAYYAVDEIILEKVSGLKSELHPTKNHDFYAVSWGTGADGKSLWLDEVQWTPSEEYDPDPDYPTRMTLYEDDVQESVLYKIATDNMKEVLMENLVPGEVYYVRTDKQGYVIEFVNADFKEYIDGENES